MKKSKSKNLNLRIIRYFLLFLMPVFLPACFQAHYLENDFIPSGKHTVVIMPEQTCTEKENGQKLFDEKILHQSHKECYYK